jgi:FAD:protein FMN transferase
VSKPEWSDRCVAERGRQRHVIPNPAEHTRRARQSAVPPALLDPGSDRRGHRCHRRHRHRGRARPTGCQRSARDDDRLVLHVGHFVRFVIHFEHLVRFGDHRRHRRYGHVFFVVLVPLDDDHDDPDDQLLVTRGDIGGNVVTPPVHVLEPRLTTRSFRAIGTTATVVVEEPGNADVAGHLLASELAAIDLACSRFRPDSELEALHAEAGRTVGVSALLFEALAVACDVAQRTHGAVDPTVGNAIAALGYDVDLDEVRSRPAVPPQALGRVAGYQHVQLDPGHRTVRIPRGVRLDLGSSAKAWAADRAAARIAQRIGAGTLVSLGGDVAVAGPAPAGGWPIGIAQESSTPAAQVDQVVAIGRGGLASSGTSARTWRAGDRDVHHIVDPRTGDCVPPYWVLVSASASSCVEANSVTTAAIVWGERALDELAGHEQAVRLVRHDGRVFVLNGWPQERAA